MVQPISAADFQEKVLSADKPVLVDFFATWCGPCKMMAPVIEEVADEMCEKASVYQMDIDENMDVARGLGIMSVPTFIVFKDGQAAQSVVGAQPKEAILAMFE